MEPVPPTFSVIVITAGLVMATVAFVMSRAAVKVMFGIARVLVLNSKPAGAFKTSVTPLLVAKSALLPSVMTMAPKLVHAGEDALAALSAEIFVPPGAGVIETVADTEIANKETKAKAYASQSNTQRVGAKKRRGASRPASPTEGRGWRPTSFWKKAEHPRLCASRATDLMWIGHSSKIGSSF